MDEGANIVEIFSSVQGEGLIVGSRQLFVRFYPCNLSCSYCDTKIEEADSKECRVEANPGKRDFYSIPNPVDIVTLNEKIFALKGFKGMHHSVSLTGGEPLMQAEFLKEWLPVLKKRFRTYLETNGTLHKELEEIIDSIDIISMDIKLPDTSGIEPKWEEHYLFLKAAKKRRVFVKVVVSSDTTSGEFVKALEMISKLDKDIPLVIQPVVPNDSSVKSPTEIQVLDFQRFATEFLSQVRVIPQCHKYFVLK